MQLIFDKFPRLIVGGVVIFLLIILVLFAASRSGSNDLATTTVERGEVNEVVAVSGFVEAKNLADLAFPSAGVVTEVFVDEGQEVKAGEVLATLGSAKLAAERNEAMAALQSAQATLDESLAGPSSQSREVSLSKVESAKAELERTINTQNKLVENARRALLSTDLEALPDDVDSQETAPTITGTYTCQEEGLYRIQILSSGGSRARDYRIVGIETGNFTAYEDSPTAMGSCGLKIQLPAGAARSYSGDDWLVEVPNTRSSSYVSNYNAYLLALETKDNEIAAAREALELAEKEANAPARDEVVTQKQASVSQAWARVQQIDAELADRSIVAPFDGVVTNVSVVNGETANTDPVITVLARDVFEVTARVPEIDIRKINNDQPVLMRFDAAAEETWHGHVTYVPQQATEIDGVAYFEVTIALDEVPDWIRSGLNADIDIVVDQAINTLRLPKRFIFEEGDIYFVWLDQEKTPVDVTFIGNDGYVAITGLEEGAVVTEPNISP